jgi:hypothetical protein
MARLPVLFDRIVMLTVSDGRGICIILSFPPSFPAGLIEVNAFRAADAGHCADRSWI